MPSYQVKQGDCIDSIARHYGLLPDTIWDHPENRRLREERQDSNILQPGDAVFVPEKNRREESAPTDQTHRFVRKGVPAKLRMRFYQPVEDEEEEESTAAAGGADDSSYEDPDEGEETPETEPMANAPYLLDIDGRLSEGWTDDDGVLEISIPPDAREGRVIFQPGTPDERIFPLQLGDMDPVSTTVGARKRLANLGYRCKPQGDDVDDDLRAAVMQFQQEHDLESNGELDDATRDKLREVHGC